MYLEFDKSHGSTYRRFLITPKLFVFFYSSSLGCLIPFLPVFFRLNGLSAVQNGFLIAARYLILFWAAPFSTFVATKLNLRKIVLVVAVLLGVVANTFFLFTADYKDHHKQKCFDNKSQIHLATTIGPTATGPSEFYHPSSSAFNFNNTRTPYQKHINLFIYTNTTKAHDYNRRMDNFRSKFEEEIFKAVGLRFDKRFLYFLLIVSVGTFLSSPAKPLHELVPLAIIKEFKASYNVQRLYSCMGWSLMSFVTAVVVYTLPCRFHLSQNAFDLHFCFHILFATTALIFGALMKSPNQKSMPKFKFWRVLRVTCKNPNIVINLIAMAILGTAQSINSTYLFWYVQDLGGNELHMGAMLLISGLSKIPLLFGTKYLINWLGHGWVFVLSLFAFGCRFLLYSYSDDPVTIIPIELLHSFTSSSIWLTSMSLAAVVAPIGLERSLQNLFTASYYGLGLGCGWGSGLGFGLGLGLGFYGPILVFRYAAVVCAVYCVIMALLQCLIPPPDESHGIPINGDYYKAGNNTNNQSDWLLEALNADEEEIQYSKTGK